jgi:hypothetical protein
MLSLQVNNKSHFELQYLCIYSCAGVDENTINDGKKYWAVLTFSTFFDSAHFNGSRWVNSNSSEPRA